MSAPQAPDQGVTYDLDVIASELRQQPSYVREGQAARTLTRTPDLRIVLVVLGAGRSISEHQAGVTASVQTLTGHVRLQLPDRSVDVPAGRLLVLGSGLPHDVQGVRDSTFLLTLGWPSNP